VGTRSPRGFIKRNAASMQLAIPIDEDFYFALISTNVGASCVSSNTYHQGRNFVVKCGGDILM